MSEDDVIKRSFRQKLMKISIIICALSFSAIALMPSSVAVTGELVVTAISDESDIAPGDGICKTSIGDQCTLRAALEEANANFDLNTITFGVEISGVSTLTIKPQSDLPVIINPLIIDGFSNNINAKQNSDVNPSSVNSKINVEIDASSISSSVLTLQADNSLVQGISMYNCPELGCINVKANNIKIFGNYLGLNANGQQVQDSKSKVAIFVSGSFSQIGSELLADKNVISNNSESQIEVSSGVGTKIQGNILGSDTSGNISKDFVNGAGVFLDGLASNALIGGIAPGQGNIFKGLSGSAVLIGENVLDNENYIATPVKNAILGNSMSQISIVNKAISSNASIDFVSLIDTSIPSDFTPDKFEQVGSNKDANFIKSPIINSVKIEKNNTLKVNFDIDTKGSTTGKYRVEFFIQSKSSNKTDNSGEIFVGSFDTSSGKGQKGSIDLNSIAALSGVDLKGKFVSASVTPQDSTTFSQFGSTSELSKAKEIN